MEWEFVSDDFNSLSLHDCDISEFVFEDDMALIFEYGFDICAENPLNETGRHKRTGKASVLLKNGKFVSAEYPEYTETDGSVIPAKKIDPKELQPLELEVYSFDYESGIFGLDCLAWTNKHLLCRVQFSCSEVLFCWNEFTDDAWFQDFGKK